MINIEEKRRWNREYMQRRRQEEGYRNVENERKRKSEKVKETNRIYYQKNKGKNKFRSEKKKITDKTNSRKRVKLGIEQKRCEKQRRELSDTYVKGLIKRSKTNTSVEEKRVKILIHRLKNVIKKIK